MRKGIYIAGSGKDAGKTTLCLGLASSLGSAVPKGVSYFKPLGQKITAVNGDTVGQDSWFISRALNLPIPLGEAGPVLASRGAAERFVNTGEPGGMPEAIRKSYRRLQGKSGLVLVEGTGHPGVGSVFGLDNAGVASMLGTPVILVLDGGIGSTIDSYTICSALFRARDVRLLGVVINRVLPRKMETVSATLKKWFGERGVPVFGIIPFEDGLAQPSTITVLREIGASPLFPLDNPSSLSGAGFLTAFEAPGEVLGRVAENPGRTLLVSASRNEVLDAVIVSKLSGGVSPPALAVCGGEPDEVRKRACRAASIPLFFTDQTLEGSAAKLTGGLFKIEPDEGGKIASVLDIVAGSVDSKRILEALSNQVGARQGVPGKGVLGFFKRLFRRG